MSKKPDKGTILEVADISMLSHSQTKLWSDDLGGWPRIGQRVTVVSKREDDGWYWLREVRQAWPGEMFKVVEHEDDVYMDVVKSIYGEDSLTSDEIVANLKQSFSITRKHLIQ